MNLVHKQHVARFEVRQQRRQISGALEHGTRGLAQVDVEFVGDDVGERRLAEPGRPEDEHVVERLAALARGLDEDLHLGLDLGLTDIVGQGFWPHGTVGRFVLPSGRPGDDAVLFDAHARS